MQAWNIIHISDIRVHIYSLCGIVTPVVLLQVTMIHAVPVHNETSSLLCRFHLSCLPGSHTYPSIPALDIRQLGRAGHPGQSGAGGFWQCQDHQKRQLLSFCEFATRHVIVCLTSRQASVHRETLPDISLLITFIRASSSGSTLAPRERSLGQTLSSVSQLALQRSAKVIEHLYRNKLAQVFHE